MVIIGNFKVSKGYETWKQAFLDNHEMREKHGIKVLAFGTNEADSDHVYTVIDVPSMEIMQNLMKEPGMIKLRENAGVIAETQQMVTINE
jgi:hypothetical protein